MRRLKAAARDRQGLCTLFSGKIGSKDVIYGLSGIGKTNAAHTASCLIRDFSPGLIINFGIGGAYPSAGLKIGDIAVAEREIYGDEGFADRSGFHGAEHIGIPLLKKGRKSFFNEFPMDKRFTQKAVKISRAAAGNFSPALAIKSGIFITVSTCTGTKKKALEMRERFGALCENMEGAAIAHIATMYDIPCIEIRGISNIVEDRDTGRWEIRRASENCQKLLIDFLESAGLL